MLLQRWAYVQEFSESAQDLQTVSCDFFATALRCLHVRRATLRSRNPRGRVGTGEPGTARYCSRSRARAARPPCRPSRHCSTRVRVGESGIAGRWSDRLCGGMARGRHGGALGWHPLPDLILVAKTHLCRKSGVRAFHGAQVRFCSRLSRMVRGYNVSARQLPKRNTCRNGNVQRINLVGHGDQDREIAGFYR